ncbi:MAG: cytochrome c oxidase subunit 4 [Mycobacteriales bacterium]
MKVEGFIFALLAVFFIPVAAVYWLVSRDPTGFTCLLLSGGFAFIVGYYVLFTARRMDARPEDRDDAEIAEGAGEVGFFAPHSWWPMILAGAFALTTIGLVFGPFLVVIGFFAVLVAAAGFVFEYYVGINRTQSFTLSAVEAMGESPTSTGKFLGEQH